MFLRPWGGHLTLIWVFTLNAMGVNLRVRSVVIGASWVSEVMSNAANVTINGMGLSMGNE